MEDLNVRLEIIKLLEENIGNKLSDTALSNIFFCYISAGKGKKINKWNYIKLKDSAQQRKSTKPKNNLHPIRG